MALRYEGFEVDANWNNPGTTATNGYASGTVLGSHPAYSTGQVAFITGAARGLGKAVAERYLQEGSSVVLHLVLNRLMESEASASAGQDRRESSISPANYTFRLLGEEDLGHHRCFVVEALPQRRDKYLFEGKIWIESQEFAVVRISGHPAKNPSFWIKRADFVRQYEKIGDFWLPARDQTFVEVRLYGKKILSIEHHIDRVNGVTPAALVAQHPPASSLSESRP